MKSFRAGVGGGGGLSRGVNVCGLCWAVTTAPCSVHPKHGDRLGGAAGLTAGVALTATTPQRPIPRRSPPQ